MLVAGRAGVSVADAAIRALTSADWPRVRAVYAEGIAVGNATFETSVPDWGEWDANHCPTPRLVVELDGQVRGWIALSPASRRAVYLGVAEVSIYVAGDYQRRGLGRLLLQHLIPLSEQAGFWTLQATIHASNTGSIALHQQAGFRLVGRRERVAQLRGAWLDTVLLERRSALI